MKILLSMLLLAGLAFGVVGCSEPAVESGTYTGTVAKVVPEEQEIYVELDDGRVLELYFTDTTELIQNEQPAEFAVLAEDQPVEVEVRAEGRRLKPIRVVILTE